MYNRYLYIYTYTKIDRTFLSDRKTERWRCITVALLATRFIHARAIITLYMSIDDYKSQLYVRHHYTSYRNRAVADDRINYNVL